MPEPKSRNKNPPKQVEHGYLISSARSAVFTAVGVVAEGWNFL
jgi:hypothetical protein